VSEQVLPPTWATVRLKELARSRMGKTILKSDLTETGLPVYSAGASTEPWGRLEGCEVSYGADTLVVSARGNIGMPKRPRQIPFVCTQTTIACSAYLPETVDWIFWFLSQFDYSTKSSQTTIPMLRTSDVDSFEIPVPPLAEQKRIVAKIEELFSELEAGEESLRLARRQLGVYRQSLLKQAFEGKLTEKWRTQNPASLESPVALIGAIQERSLNANFKANDDHKIPSWSYRTLDELTESVTSGSRGWADYYAESGSIFIRAQNLNQDFLNLADIAYVQLPESAEGKRTRVKYGDLLITITGANTTKAGWVSTQLDEAYVSQHVALCRPVSDSLSPFLYRYIIADAGGRKRLTADAYGAGKPGLNLDNVRSLTVPLPSLPEQQEIVRLLDEQFEVIERNERELDAALERSAALRQAILKKAFTGRLVPQDPSDEPASALLARLRAE
jgi:type I restriction enzyme S subunit